MKLPRPRFTHRSLMISVFGLGGWVEVGRLYRLAAYYADQAEENREWAGSERQHMVPYDQWLA